MKIKLSILFVFFSTISKSQLSSEAIPTLTWAWLYHNNTIWQLTNAGIYIRDENTLKVLDKFNIVNDQEIYTDIKEDRFNNIWIAMEDNGIAKFDGKDWTIWNSRNTPVFLPNNRIEHIGIEADGTVWASALGQFAINTSIYIFKNNTWTLDTSKIIDQYDVEFASGSNNEFLAVTEDTILLRQNNQWIGVPEFDDQDSPYHKSPCFDAQGHLWLIDRWERLLKYESLSEKPNLIAEDPNGLSDLILDDDGNPWLINDTALVVLKDQKWISMHTLAGTDIISSPLQLLNGSNGKIYVNQNIYTFYSQDVVTVIENFKPISNHYIDYSNTYELGMDGNGNLWFGGSLNVLTRKNISDGKFDYFELFQFPLKDFESGVKLISGNGDEILVLTNTGRLIHFNGKDWNEIKEIGNGNQIVDAVVSGDNFLYVGTGSYIHYNEIYKYDFNNETWTKIDVNSLGLHYYYSLHKGIHGSVWIDAGNNLVKINSDGALKLYTIPDNNSIEDRIGFDVNDNGFLQFYGANSVNKNSFPVYQFNSESEIWNRYFVPDKLYLDLAFALDVEQILSIIDNKNHIWMVYNASPTYFGTISVWNFDGINWNNVFEGDIASSFRMTGMFEGKDGNIYLLGQDAFVTINPSTSILGKTLVDNNRDCISDINDSPFPQLDLLINESNGSQHLFYSNYDGAYSIYQKAGKMKITSLPPSQIWKNCEPNGIDLELQKDSSVHLDFLLDKINNCPSIQVQLESKVLRQCDLARMNFEIVNSGTAIADSVSAIITLPLELNIQNSDIPYTFLGNQQYQFYIGTLNLFEKRTFKLEVNVSCNANIGQSMCLKINTYPNNWCYVNPDWTGADVRLSGKCEDDQVKFELWNKGTSATTSSLHYSIYKNDVQGPEVPYSLVQGEKLNVNIPSDGSTYRLVSNQEKDHPEEKYGLSIAIEDCNNKDGSINRGFMNSQKNFTGSPNELIYCLPIRGSYDPNEKLTYPVGIGETTHFINRDEELEYTIHFQNTGNDTAKEVKILDSLDRYLDVSTFKLLQSSHPLHIEIIDGVLICKFSNINLPDSTINFNSSSGFVKFNIKPRKNIPYGYYISNKASIYFDSNIPITTNDVWHIINPLNRIASNTNNEKTEKQKNQLLFFPNPTNSNISIDTKQFNDFMLSVFEVNGKKLESKYFSGNQNSVEFSMQNYPAGLYFMVIVNNDGKRYFGKAVKQ